MRYLVTGGAGFVGSHLVDRLMAMGDVTVYDNLSSGKKEFIGHHLGSAGFQFIEADLLDADVLKGVMQGHDAVFHLAANSEVRTGTGSTDVDLKQGTVVTYHVLEAMRINDIKKLVFASSSTVCGETPVAPVGEDYGPLQPISLYGASKLAGEGLISAFCHLFGMQAWIYRFANVVGARAGHGVIFDFMNKLKREPEQLEVLGDGTQEKPYIHVADCVEGIIFGFEHSDAPVNVFNLGCTSSTNVTAIADMVVGEMGLSDVMYIYNGGGRGWPGDVPQVRFDVSRLEELGWRARYTSDEAVRRAIRDILGKHDREAGECRQLSWPAVWEPG